MTLTAKAGLKKGVEITIGGEIYMAPPMNFGSLRKLRLLPVTASYADDLMGFVLQESLKRNYDGVDALWLNENIEGNEIEALQAALVEIMTQSGLKPPADAKAPPSGEAEAVTE